MDLVDRHFDEVARVLKPAGHLLILNFSYRDDLKQDRSDIAVLAARRGFELRRSTAQDFTLPKRLGDVLPVDLPGFQSRVEKGVVKLDALDVFFARV